MYNSSVIAATKADKRIYQTVNLELKDKCARSKYHLGTNIATVYKEDELAILIEDAPLSNEEFCTLLSRMLSMNRYLY